MTTDTDKRLAEIRERAEKATGGEWRRMALGGMSTVISNAEPTRNEHVPAYGYRDGNGHCIGYPFLDDNRQVRNDFICMSHEDADFIANARTDIPFLLAEIERLSKERDVARARYEEFAGDAGVEIEGW